MQCHHVEILDREGVICQLCGLVLDQHYVNNKIAPPLYISTTLSDICARLHTPYYPQVKACFDKLSQHHPKISPKYLRAIALYTTLNKMQSSRDLEQLCFLCNIESHNFWKVSKQVQEIDDSFSYHFADTFLASLQLPYLVVEEIKKKALLVPGSFSPKTVLGALAYQYIKKTDSKTTLKALAKQLGISCMSTYRCWKKCIIEDV